MSAYSIEKLPGESIIYSYLSEAWNADVTDSYTEELLSWLDSTSEPVIFILDVSEVKANVQIITVAANALVRSTDAPLKHPMVIENLLVADSDLVKLGAQGLNSQVFGHLIVKVYDNFDDALSYARKKNGRGVKP